MVSNQFFTIPAFLCIFPMNFAMATLGLKEMGRKGKKLPSWLLSFAKLRQPTGADLFPYLPKEIFSSPSNIR
jgi:hypothetical protein